MTTAVELLKAPRCGIREFKTHLSEKIKSHKTMVLVEHGEPKKVVIDYDKLVELVEFIEDMQEQELINLLHEGGRAVARGEKGINVEESFAKIKARRKR
jgi:hypothetical protein